MLLYILRKIKGIIMKKITKFFFTILITISYAANSQTAFQSNYKRLSSKLNFDKDFKTAEEIEKAEEETKAKIFKTIEEIRSIIKNVRSIYLKEDENVLNPYEELNNMEAIRKNIIPLYMVSPAINAVNEIEKNPWGYNLINSYKGLVNIGSAGEEYDHKYFKITYSGLDPIMCEALLLAKWGDEFLGMVWLGANGKYFTWNEKLSENKLPVVAEEAAEICKNGGYFQIGWR
jgi:hypothetical protein